MERLSDEQLAEQIRRHYSNPLIQRLSRGKVQECIACGTRWPCLHVRLATDLTQTRARLAQAEAEAAVLREHVASDARNAPRVWQQKAAQKLLDDTPLATAHAARVQRLEQVAEAAQWVLKVYPDSEFLHDALVDMERRLAALDAAGEPGKE